MTEIAMQAGFGSLRRFNSAFAEVYSRPPTKIRRPRGSARMAEQTVEDATKKKALFSPRAGSGNERLVRIGAVLAYRSGKGRTLLIDALPVDQNWDGGLVEIDAIGNKVVEKCVLHGR
jgi:AraC family transcriptional regulator of adaptative response / DNA-3-methyladenine glycosylase II